MLDINVKIANLLKELAPVELAGSEKPLEMPCIYIEQVSNSNDVTFDNKDFLTDISYQIDIYAETPRICAEMAQAVSDIMQENGFTRSNAIPMERQRYVLTFRGKVSEKYSVYRE